MKHVNEIKKASQIALRGFLFGYETNAVFTYGE